MYLASIQGMQVAFDEFCQAGQDGVSDCLLCKNVSCISVLDSLQRSAMNSFPKKAYFLYNY
jgi:hypothetical protein